MQVSGPPGPGLPIPDLQDTKEVSRELECSVKRTGISRQQSEQSQEIQRENVM